MRWILLLRAVNLGATNKLPMTDLARILSELGHTDVKTYLNSGNATFEGSARSPQLLATEVEQALRDDRGLDVRACVRRERDIRTALDQLPELPGYVTVTVLFDAPERERLQQFLAMDWSPEVVAGNDQAIYGGYVHGGRTALSLAKLERALGVTGTGRTPATLHKLLAHDERGKRSPDQ